MHLTRTFHRLWTVLAVLTLLAPIAWADGDEQPTTPALVRVQQAFDQATRPTAAALAVTDSWSLGELEYRFGELARELSEARVHVMLAGVEARAARLSGFGGEYRVDLGLAGTVRELQSALLTIESLRRRCLAPVAAWVPVRLPAGVTLVDLATVVADAKAAGVPTPSGAAFEALEDDPRVGRLWWLGSGCNEMSRTRLAAMAPDNPAWANALDQLGALMEQFYTGNLPGRFVRRLYPLSVGDDLRICPITGLRLLPYEVPLLHYCEQLRYAYVHRDAGQSSRLVLRLVVPATATTDAPATLEVLGDALLPASRVFALQGVLGSGPGRPTVLSIRYTLGEAGEAVVLLNDDTGALAWMTGVTQAFGDGAAGAAREQTGLAMQTIRQTNVVAQGDHRIRVTEPQAMVVLDLESATDAPEALLGRPEAGAIEEPVVVPPPARSVGPGEAPVLVVDNIIFGSIQFAGDDKLYNPGDRVVDRTGRELLIVSIDPAEGKVVLENLRTGERLELEAR